MSSFLRVSIFVSLAVVLGCARPPMTNESPSTNDIKFINGSSVGEWIESGNYGQWVISGWQLKVQNIGTKPVSQIKFRLKIWKKENEQMMYSQVHTVEISLDPQDILTSETFPLKEKFWYAEKDIFLENKFGWNAEIIQVW